MTHLYAVPQDAPADERAGLDIVASHLRARHRDRQLMLTVAGILSVLVAVLALHNVVAVMPVPDATFAFRV